MKSNLKSNSNREFLGFALKINSLGWLSAESSVLHSALLWKWSRKRKKYQSITE